jgi:DNA-directed RNA polymerase specialized sigma24 family protein
MTRGNALATDTLAVYFDLAGRAAASHCRAKGLPAHMREDLTQAGILWLLEHPGELDAAKDPDGRPYTSRLVGRIRMYYVRAGLDSQEHDAFVDKKYTPDLVALVFPALYDPGYMPFRDQDEAGERFSERDAAEANTWQAVIADVSSAVDAYGRLEDGIRYVWLHEVLGESFDSIGERMGVSRSTAHRKVADTLSWLADWLNGDRYEPEPDAEE